MTSALRPAANGLPGSAVDGQLLAGHLLECRLQACLPRQRETLNEGLIGQVGVDCREIKQHVREVPARLGRGVVGNPSHDSLRRRVRRPPSPTPPEPPAGGRCTGGDVDQELACVPDDGIGANPLGREDVVNQLSRQRI